MKTVIPLSIVSLFVVVTFISCKRDPVLIPSCIQQKIDSIKNISKTTPPSEVHLWNYGGRKVYLFNATCCDKFVKVFDESCKYVCAPSGGPSQIGDSLCIDFYQTAKYVGSVWRDDR